MRLSLATLNLALFILVGFFPTGSLAQTFDWNSPAALELVSRATERRQLVLADSGLRSYKAEARGYLTFLAQISDGFREPPKVVKTDQIVSDLYWRAPNLSKQLIKGRRDTLLLPTDIHYHRDHLGIIQNNFPSIIRLGDGDEVSDVPHPLSPEGRMEYDFSMRDSLRISIGGDQIQVYELAVRPRDPAAPRAVGSIYIESSRAELVRMTLSFTRSALREKSLEDVTVVLENGLIDGQFWLPRQQSIEIRRIGSWLEYPVRGIIRGRWEISGYQINVPFDVNFFGPEILAAPGSKVTSRGMVEHPEFHFEDGILESIPPDVSVATDADVQRVQNEARELVRAQALERSRQTALSGRRISDFVRYNRVEGLAVGAGVSQSLGLGFAVSARAAYGFSDGRLKGEGGFSYNRASGAGISLRAYSRLFDLSAVPERSGLINSFASQEFGSDHTSPVRQRGVGVAVSGSSHHTPVGHLTTSLVFALDRFDSAGLHAKPASGRFHPVPQLLPFEEGRAALEVDLRDGGAFGSANWHLTAKIGAIRGRPATPGSNLETWGKTQSNVSLTFNLGQLQIHQSLFGVAIFGPTPAPTHHLVLFGGNVSAPGYDFHSLSGKTGISHRLEPRFKAPFPRISLGGFGKTPGQITVAPYVNTVWMDGAVGWRPSAGLAVLSIFDLLRLDVAKGLRDGRWTFGFDINRSFWGVL